MGYLKDLWTTFKKQPIKILSTSFLIWVIFPVLIFALGGIGLLFQIISLEVFTNLFSNAFIFWWASIFMGIKRFVLEYLLLFILTLILVNHNIIETISFSDLINALKPKK